MKTFLALMFYVTALTAARAQIDGQPPSVYLNHLTATMTVRGENPEKIKWYGYTIISPAGNRSIQLLTFLLNDRLYVECRTNQLKSLLPLAPFKNFSAVGGYSPNADVATTILLKGKWAPITNGGTAWEGPKTLSVSGHSIYANTAEDVSGTLTLSISDTFSPDNTDVDSTADSLFTLIKNGFYIPIHSPIP